MPKARNSKTPSELLQDLPMQQQKILQYIDSETQRRGYPPSVREICKAVNLKSPSSAHYHLDLLQQGGWLQRDESSPRALRVSYDFKSGLRGERRSTRYVPLVDGKRAGFDRASFDAVEALYPLPSDLVGEGELLMLRVTADVLAQAGAQSKPGAQPKTGALATGDYVVVRVGAAARSGDLVVLQPSDSQPAAIIRRYQKRGKTAWLEAADPSAKPKIAPVKHKPAETKLLGRVVTIVRQV